VRSIWLTGIGFAWPLLIGVVMAAGCYVVQPKHYQFDGVMHRLLILSLFAVPVVGGCLYRWLPQKWSHESRVIIAVLLTVPIACLQTYTALCVFVWATLPLGWIE
jgi:hypothetical protein